MKLHDGMTLYHGSFASVKAIDLDRCAAGKDFGAGFYLTSELDQAVHFISTSLRKAGDQNLLETPTPTWGYVSSFVFHGNPEDFHYLEFQTADAEWLKFVAMNRMRGKRELPPDFALRHDEAEIIAGKIANDNTNRVLRLYLDELPGPMESPAAIDFAISRLIPDRLKDQFCFRTPHAIESLTFLETKRYDI